MFVVFDFDGVIIDSAPAVHRAANELGRHLGLSPVSLDEAKMTWMGPSIAQAVTHIRTLLGLPEARQQELEEVYFNAYVEAAPALTRSYPHMLELLAELEQRSIPKALATMKAQAEMAAMLSPLPGLSHFGVVAAPLDLLGSSKKALVGQAIEALSKDVTELGNGFMIGDRAGDIEAGKFHGLRTIAVTWGAGTLAELDTVAPDFIVDDVGTLREVLFAERS